MSHNRFALSLTTLKGSHDVRHLNQKIKAASQAGFFGISIHMADVEAWVKSGKRIQQLLETVREHGMEIVELCEVPICDARGRLADRSREFATAAALEVPLVSAVYNKEPADLEHARADWRAFCDTVADMEDIKIGLHFKGTAEQFNTLDHAWDITNDGPANGRIVMDLYDFWRGGSPASSLEMVPIDLVSMVHVTDVGTIHRYAAEEQHRVFPGTGLMPLTHIISTLSRRGYNGMFSVEVNGDSQRVSSKAVAQEAYRATRKLLGTSGPSHRKLLAYVDNRAMLE